MANSQPVILKHFQVPYEVHMLNFTVADTVVRHVRVYGSCTQHTDNSFVYRTNANRSKVL
jgi:hypothetical protein